MSVKSKHISGFYLYKLNDENDKEKFQGIGAYKNEMQLGDILNGFLEEVERANCQGNGRARNKRYRKQKGI